MIREVIQLGHPTLRAKCKPVDDVFDPQIQTLIDDMIDTLIDQKGIGLAAPQIGVDYQLFIVAPEQKFKRPNDSLENGLVVINPKIEFLPMKETLEWEGCLSIPGIRGLVPRACNIKITYTNRMGELKVETYSEFTARIFLHEYDHLNGVMFLDRLNNIKTDLITDSVYAKLVEEHENQ